MGEIFAEIGDLIFTIVVGYISAIEFLYVVRHLYHYSCNHEASEGVDSNENLSQLQDSMRQQLVKAKNKEDLAGTQVMKDGVPYRDGFRLDDQQALIDQLKELLKNKELSDLRRQELEKELAKQMKIAEKLRKEIAEAEASYQRQLKQEEEAKAKKLLEEQKRQREQEERAKKEAEEQARRLAAAEKQKEAEQRKREEEKERIKKEAEQKDKERKIREEQERRAAEEQALKLAEAERQREAEQRQREEAEENAHRLQELEKQKETEQRIIEEREQEEKRKAEVRRQQEMAEAEENARRLLEQEKANEEKQAAEEAAAELAAKKLLAIEHHLEEQLRAAEREAELNEKERQLIDSIKKRDLRDDKVGGHKDAELLRKILEAREQLGEESEEEQSLRLVQRERDQEAKQKRIEENALLFLEAEKEMAELQSRMLDGVENKIFRSSLDSAPHTPIVEEPCIKRTFSPLTGTESTHSTVKTQLAQDLDEPYAVRTKPLLFPGVSDDASSIDPASSQKSSFSTQPSEDSQYLAQERQDPDGEDNLIHQQYSDDYLRSLDGIKQRPLMREDGSGRRRAFKKRRSSNSSNSSRESRQSRDEELKMFTSLEEEEMKDTADSEFTPIRYSTEPSLKVKGHHHRRHKRSPAKDMRRGDDSLRSSLERLGEETGDPWGEVKPEHYKHTEFWKREKTLSIDEEAEFEKPTSSEETAYNTATNLPSASSFEEATQKQNQEALSTLQKQSAQRSAQEGKSDGQTNLAEEPARSGNTNLHTSTNHTEKDSVSGRSSVSPHLRLGLRQQEETNKSASSSTQNTPSINVQTPLDYGPWRDEYGLMMEGLSDFYDFTASVNPSRSRSASRNVSPANSAPNTPQPKNVSFQLKLAHEKAGETAAIEIYDDTEERVIDEFKKENIIKFIDSLSDKEGHAENENEKYETILNEVEISKRLKPVADDPSSTSNEASLVPLVNIIEDSSDGGDAPNLESDASADMSMNTLVSTLRSQQSQRSRSRSKSPLPTADNLKRSVENRRYKMIKHNEDILEKLIESKLLPELSLPEEEEEKKTIQPLEVNPTDNEISSREEENPLVQTLQVDSRRSRSKSPMRLPTPENLSKGLEKRRSKLIERNDELIKQLEERSLTPESPSGEHVYNISSSEDMRSYEQTERTVSSNEEDTCTKEEMATLVQSLRVARSRTRSKSPFTIQEVENRNEVKTYYGFHNSEYIETTHSLDTATVPTISIDFSEVEDKAKGATEIQEDEECSKDNMELLVQSLRAARSRSTSRSPMRTLDSTLMQHMRERSKTPEPSSDNRSKLVDEGSRYSRSRTPSRSHSASPEATALYRSNTPSRSLSPQPEEYEDYRLTIEQTLAEDEESFLLTSHQRQLDEEALEKLRVASEEMELRTLSPLTLKEDELAEQQGQDNLSDLPLMEKVRLLKKSPTTPDYDRTVSEEVRDNERIKEEMLKKGFKRSTYVGESMDLGSEFEPLRKEAAKFQRSRSPSPSFSTIESATAQRKAEENRKIQDLVLQELSASAGSEQSKCKNTGAIPKTERLNFSEVDVSPSSEIDKADTFRFSTYSESLSENFEEMRRRNAEFRRSASASRSPLCEAQKEQLAGIEVEAAKRVLKDKILDNVSFNSRDISRGLNLDFFNNDRRASDSALMKVPDILVQLKDDEDMEPEEYHHYRRFSLALEEPQEQYPGDDYIFIEQVEVRTRSGSRTWLREDFYSENVEDYLRKGENLLRTSVERGKDEALGEERIAEVEAAAAAAAGDEDEEYSNASDDDRQTVVEVDDEIDEDISDFNERGPAEESHHEISECEEAEREADRYAGRGASDWNRVADAGITLHNENPVNRRINIEEDEGAVGGLSNSPYDSDSFAIDQIYDEAIKNRKQSGILREYDNILRQMSSSSDIDEQYLLWSKTNVKKTPKNIEFNTQFLDNERRESEMRYLGDASTTARQSARLHSRYGYKPILQAKCLEDDLEVDINYKPKREYNWRKNFTLDDDVVKEDKEISAAEFYYQREKYEMEKQREEANGNEEIGQLGVRQLSLEEESRSPVRTLSLAEEGVEEDKVYKNEMFAKEEAKEDNKQGSSETPKKKKTKKKSHKESKASLEETMNREDEESYDNQVFSRRSSSIQMETDSPKRKSRSRRSSKSSLTNEDSLGLFSPRSSVACNENIEDIMEEYTEEVKTTTRPKKMKKRKKVREMKATVAESNIETREEIQFLEALNDIPPVSTVITPESSSANILSTLSPQNSVCITPASIESDINFSIEELREVTTNSSTTTTTTDSSPSANLSRTSSLTTTTPVDNFDILKDANFYPLF